jgi:hypothetical protein
MRLAHRYYDTLIEIERSCRDAIDALLGDRTLTARVAAIDERESHPKRAHSGTPPPRELRAALVQAFRARGGVVQTVAARRSAAEVLASARERPASRFCRHRSVRVASVRDARAARRP